MGHTPPRPALDLGLENPLIFLWESARIHALCTASEARGPAINPGNYNE